MSAAEHSPNRSRARPLPRVLGRTAPTLAPAMTESLLVEDVPDATADERSFAVDEVRGRIAAMPDVLRAGVGIASRVAAVGLSALVRRRFVAAPVAVRSGPAQRLAGADLPVTVELGRLCRGLGLAAVYERRTPELMRRAGLPQ